MKLTLWTEFVPDDPVLGPPKPWRCVDGWKSHEWTMSLEESRPTFTCECRLCSDGMEGAIADEITVEMPAIRVSAELVIEHYGDDVTEWINITPFNT